MIFRRLSAFSLLGGKGFVANGYVLIKKEIVCIWRDFIFAYMRDICRLTFLFSRIYEPWQPGRYIHFFCLWNLWMDFSCFNLTFLVTGKARQFFFFWKANAILTDPSKWKEINYKKHIFQWKRATGDKAITEQRHINVSVLIYACLYEAYTILLSVQNTPKTGVPKVPFSSSTSEKMNSKT